MTLDSMKRPPSSLMEVSDENFDAINDALDVEPSIVPVEETPKPVQKPKEKDDINKDYEYSRGNLYSLIEKGQEASSMVFLNLHRNLILQEHMKLQVS